MDVTRHPNGAREISHDSQDTFDHRGDRQDGSKRASSMNIGLVGATGMIGQRVLAEALNRNHSVTALTHDPTHVPRQRGAVTWKVADVLQADSIAAILPSLDVLVSAYGPGPRSNSAGQYPPEAVDEAIRRADTLVTAARAMLKALENRPSLRLIVVGGAASLEIQLL